MRMMRVCIISSRHSAPLHPLSGCAAALTQNSRGTYGFSRNQKETCYVRTVTKLHLVSSRQKLNNPSPALTLMSSWPFLFLTSGKDFDHQNYANNFHSEIGLRSLFFVRTAQRLTNGCEYPGRYSILEWHDMLKMLIIWIMCYCWA